MDVCFHSISKGEEKAVVNNPCMANFVKGIAKYSCRNNAALINTAFTSDLIACAIKHSFSRTPLDFDLKNNQRYENKLHFLCYSKWTI